MGLRLKSPGASEYTFFAATLGRVCPLMTGSTGKKIAVIAGAGPAGLTAALELLRRTDITPLVIEADTQVGGISKTVEYRGNRMDLGGHRFFSKSDWVMQWWQEILPVELDQQKTPIRLDYQRQSREFLPQDKAPINPDEVMLVRERVSRIFYRRRFFDYPLKLNGATLRNMGLMETLRVGASYGVASMWRRSPENSLEDFLVNRFGERLYRIFFKDYTEKVWGVPCTEISAEWGAQRIKGLSITRALTHAVANKFRARDTAQKRLETSLIERFLYPKYGPGQMWECVARRVTELGGEVSLSSRVVGIDRTERAISAVWVRDEVSGVTRRIACQHFISTMPVRDLSTLLKPQDSRVVHVARHLPYRDFMTAGLLLRKMKRNDARSSANGMPPDNWIYIQESDVRLGRLQVFNNWSPHLVADPQTIWLGLEYFCAEGDDLWSMNNGRFLDFAASELEKIGLIDRRDVVDGTVVRVPKAYPAYFGEYNAFATVRRFLDSIENLHPIGRNGMHRYNNQDHSMLAARCAVDCILSGETDRSALWAINAENDYHEEIG